MVSLKKYMIGPLTQTPKNPYAENVEVIIDSIEYKIGSFCESELKKKILPVNVPKAKEVSVIH